MATPKEGIIILEIDNQKWMIRFTPHCFILATDKTKIIFDYPDDKLPCSAKFKNTSFRSVLKFDKHKRYKSSLIKFKNSVLKFST